MTIRLAISLLSAVWVMCLLAGCDGPPEKGGSVDIAQALSSDAGDACFEKATSPAGIKFPEDNGPHDTFKTEWWYYTGNLRTESGRHFGFQLTFFRQALDCGEDEAVPTSVPATEGAKSSGNSAWRTRQFLFCPFCRHRY